MTGAVGPGRDPATVGQRLEVPADRRLGKLHDSTKLGHRELMPVEEQQEPASRGVRERGEVVVDGGGGLAHGVLLYPLIRMEGYHKPASRGSSSGTGCRETSSVEA